MPKQAAGRTARHWYKLAHRRAQQREKYKQDAKAAKEQLILLRKQYRQAELNNKKLRDTINASNTNVRVAFSCLRSAIKHKFKKQRS